MRFWCESISVSPFFTPFLATSVTHATMFRICRFLWLVMVFDTQPTQQKYSLVPNYFPFIISLIKHSSGHFIFSPLYRFSSLEELIIKKCFSSSKVTPRVLHFDRFLLLTQFRGRNKCGNLLSKMSCEMLI